MHERPHSAVRSLQPLGRAARHSTQHIPSLNPPAPCRNSGQASTDAVSDSGAVQALLAAAGTPEGPPMNLQHARTAPTSRRAALTLAAAGLLASIGLAGAMLGSGRAATRFEYAVVSGASASGLYVRFASGEISDRETMAEFLKLERSFDREQLGPLMAVEIMTSTGWELVDFEILQDGDPRRVTDRVYLLRRGV